MESLKPDADRIYASVLGEEKAKTLMAKGDIYLSPGENARLYEDFKSMMKEKYGDGWEKFFIDIVIGECTEVTYSPASSKGFSVVDGSDAAYQYEMFVEARSFWWPFGTYNRAITEHWSILLTTGERSFDNVMQIRSRIQDELTPGTVAQTGPANQITAVGNTRAMWWPPLISPCYTEHEVWDENIWNDHILRSYSWASQ